MIVRLRKPHAPADLEAVLELCAKHGFRSQFLDSERSLLQVEGPARPQFRSELEDLVAVHRVLDAGDSPELFARAANQPDTVVAVREARFGGGELSIIAGPCAVEDEASLIEIARGVQSRGACLLRGGAFKPRTSPYSFQGLGQRGLDALGEARLATGIGIVTEVLDPRDVEAVGAVADMFQIGSRNMSNSSLLREVGRTRTPVLLKRGFAATVRELLLAAEFVLSEGNTQVVLCERGIRGFDDTTRNLLDVGAVAHLKRATHLPVIVDPSHAAGRADLVRPLARAGLAAGADGLIVEVHPRPAEAHSDAAQAIGLEAFGQLVQDAQALAALDGAHVVAPQMSLS